MGVSPRSLSYGSGSCSQWLLGGQWGLGLPPAPAQRRGRLRVSLPGALLPPAPPGEREDLCLPSHRLPTLSPRVVYACAEGVQGPHLRLPPPPRTGRREEGSHHNKPFDMYLTSMGSSVSRPAGRRQRWALFLHPLKGPAVHPGTQLLVWAGPPDHCPGRARMRLQAPSLAVTPTHYPRKIQPTDFPKWKESFPFFPSVWGQGVGRAAPASQGNRGTESSRPRAPRPLTSMAAVAEGQLGKRVTEPIPPWLVGPEVSGLICWVSS